MWQAEHIRARLAAMYPACEVGLLGLTTQGDQILDQPLADIGGKGLFIKELEVAMAEGRADLAVHSLKDVPMDMPEGFTLAAIGMREDPRDAFVSNRYLDLAQLPGGARVGTSSLRREAQLRERDPLLQIMPLRGNVNTRLRKLDEGQYDAIILAAAGLKRLGFGARIASLLDPEESLPAVGQGALALECRADRADVIAALQPLADAATTLAVTAERAFSRALSGSCHTPLAAHAVRRHDELWLRGLLASRDGKEVMRGERAAAVADAAAADALGLALADEFLARGAARLTVARVRTSTPHTLAGIGVLVTRPARQAAGFASRIAALGGTPIIFPAIAILPPEDSAALERAHAALAEYDFAVFVSANAVEYGVPDCAALAGRIDRVRAGSRHRAGAGRRRHRQCPRSGVELRQRGPPRVARARRATRQARADLPRRRRTRASGRHVAHARRARGLRRVLSPRTTAGRRGRARRGVRAGPHPRRHHHVERRASTTCGAWSMRRHARRGAVAPRSRRIRASRRAPAHSGCRRSRRPAATTASSPAC